MLITVLTVFLAYNANNGLPFVQSYRLTAQVPNAAALVPGNEVRIGGVRVGVVESIDPVAEDDGTFAAALALKLDKSVEPLPEDSTVIIRSRSALGLKYVQIVRGTSDQGYPAGSTLPLSSATPEPVEFDQLLSTFDEPTQENIQENLTEFGNALAGRGPNINEFIGAAEAAAATARTGDARHLRSADRHRPVLHGARTSASAVAPVAETQAQMFVDLDTTLAAFADIARPYLQDTISKTPMTLAAASGDLPIIRPFLVNSRKLFVNLQPGCKAAAESADQIESALVAGIPVLRASPQFNDQLPPTAASLKGFNDNSTVRDGLGQLIDLNNALGPPLKFIAPAQSVCNYATLLFRNAANAASKGNANGNWQRGNAVNTPSGPNNEGSPSSAPANGGGGGQQELPARQPLPEHRRAQPEPDRVRGGQRDLREGSAVDRQRARQPGYYDRGPDPIPAQAGGWQVMARSRRPKPGVKDFNEGIYHRPPLGLSFFKTGVLAAIVILILTYFAYTKELPWSSQGYTATATFSNATTLRPDCSSPDRRRQRRQGHRHRAERRERERHLHRRSRGSAAARRRDDHDPAPPLPRRQLLPRSAPGQPERARSAGRRLDPGDAGRRRPSSSTRC